VPGSSALERVAYALLAFALLALAFFFLATAIAAGAILALALWVRLWWRGRRMRRAAARAETIAGEYRVVEGEVLPPERDERR
jgi:small-conductance mechanosensitive channel